MHTNQLKLWKQNFAKYSAIYMRIACSIGNVQTFFKPLLGGYQKQEQTQHRFKLVLFITYHFISLPFLSTVAMIKVSTLSPPFAEETWLLRFCSLCQFQAPAPPIYHPFVA
jgi:hypothetical protein